MRWLRYVWRVFLWAIRSLWRKYPKPTKEFGFSRSHMRKVWKPYLQAVDRAFNKGRNRQLLMSRAVMVARRRQGKLPDVLTE